MTATVRVVVHHTLVELDLNHPHTAGVMADAQELHRLVMRMFRHWVPDGEEHPRALMGILHTSAVDLARRTLTVIVQSLVPADTSALPARMLTAPPQSRIVTITVTAGQDYLFRTTITPSRYGFHNGRYTRDGPTDASPAAALTWITHRLQPDPAITYDRHPLIGADAQPEDLRARTLPTITAHKPGRPVSIARAEIHGRLTVTDPAAFARTFTEGLGRGRAYGCGLLLVQPAPTRPTPAHATARTDQRPCTPPASPALPRQTTPIASLTSSPATSTPSRSTASAPPTPSSPPGPSTSTSTTWEPSTITPVPAGTSNAPANATPTSTTPSAPCADHPPGPVPALARPNGHSAPSAPPACASSTSRPPAYTIPGPSRSPSVPQATSSSTN